MLFLRRNITLKLRNLLFIVLALAVLVVLLDVLSRSNDIYMYISFLLIIITPFLLIGYLFFTKKYKGERIISSLILAVIGSFVILYIHFYLQDVEVSWGIPIQAEANDYGGNQLLFSFLVRINLLLTIVYGMYFSVASFRKK